MKSTTITPNLIQLTKFGLMNAYLVREDDGFTLVDTTMNAAEEIIAAATAAGAEIQRIALTHGHTDHVGSLDALRDKLGADVPVLITETDAKILAGDKRVDYGPKGKKRGGWPKLSTPLTQFIAPGERIASLEVVAAPGHTPGQVAFRDTRDGSLIAGDAFSSIGGLSVPSHLHWSFPLPFFATCSRPQAAKTGQSLRELEPSTLALGHGKVLSDPARAMDRALGNAARPR